MIPFEQFSRKVRFLKPAIFFNIKFQYSAILEVQGSNLQFVWRRCVTVFSTEFKNSHHGFYHFFFFRSGVKFSSDTKEFTVSIPGKGNTVFNMEKKVKT